MGARFVSLPLVAWPMVLSASLMLAGPAAGQAVPPLPAPKLKGLMSLEEALAARRSTREFGAQALSLAQVSQLLWAAQGVSDARGYRTAPSAGALFPLEVYLVVARVAELSAGVYHYDSAGHRLALVLPGDRLPALAAAALGQASLRQAPAALVIAGVYQRSAQKYGERAVRYVAMEAGHAAQNVYLQAAASGLATVLVGAFDDAALRQLLELPAGQAPLALMAIGHHRPSARAAAKP